MTRDGKPRPGQLDGDTLKLVAPHDSGSQTVRVKKGTRAHETRRAQGARTKRRCADAVTRAVITRVALAYEAALDPSQRQPLGVAWSTGQVDGALAPRLQNLRRLSHPDESVRRRLVVSSAAPEADGGATFWH
jgi:hypothetical protein